MKRKHQAGYMMVEAMLSMAVNALAFGLIVIGMRLIYIDNEIRANAKFVADYQDAVQVYMSRFYGNLIQNTMIGGVLTPAFQSPMCDPSGRNTAHIAAYNNASLNREDGRRACLIPPTTGNTCNNNETGCVFVYPACDAAISNRPCVTGHLRSYPLNPNASDLLAMQILKDGYPTEYRSPSTLVSAIYKNGAGPDGYNLQAMIALDQPITKGDGEADLTEVYSIVDRLGPDGGAAPPNFGGSEHLTPLFYAAAGQITGASNYQIYVLGGMDYATAAPTLGYDDPAKLMIQWSRAGLEADKAAGRNLWPGLSGYPQGGVLVMRAGFGSANMDQYARLDGTKPFTGNVNLGGNKIGNLAQVEIDMPCDGSNAASAASKAMDGQIANHTPKVADPNNVTEKLGSAYVLVCGYDAFSKGYVWKKATAGVASVEDAQAGMFEGWETSSDFVCFRLPGDVVAGGTVPATAVINNGINRIKFMIKNGKAYVYIAANINSAAAGWMQAGGPYELDGRAYDWVNTGAFPVLDYDLGNAPTTGSPLDGYKCRWGYGWYYTATGGLAPPYAPGATVRNNPFDQYFAVLASWKFSPGGVEFIVNGAVSRQNKVFNYPASPYNYGGVVKDSANHTQDDLSRIPVTANGATTDQAVMECIPTKIQVLGTDGQPHMVTEDIACTKANLYVNATGQTTPRPANSGLPYDPTTNAEPVRVLTPVTAQYNRSFKFQQKSNCARLLGQAANAQLSWGVAPAATCDW